jgi:sacsin
MDPHCRYTPGANELSPGRRFDKLNEGFWQDFPDMKSAYLRGGTTNVPSELSKGSLFRFPIRHDKRKIPLSNIVDDIENAKSCLSAEELDRDLRLWMLKMKEAMLFLNNVTELKLYVIEDGKAEMSIIHHFRSEIEDSARNDREVLQGALSAFKCTRNCQPHVIMHPLTLTEVNAEGKDIVEKWLIQQGVGDIYDEQHEWKYINSVKPRHGIAAPQSLVTKRTEFRGQVFCFLPLPVESDFPVHVNGHFILNSTRRELWRSSDIRGMDDRSRWNANLVQALSSSYADFLLRARSHYVTEEYKTLRTAVDAIGHYYSLFPKVNTEKSYWNTLASEVYNSIVRHNHPVFCTIVTKTNGEGCTTVWYPPRCAAPADQVYYWPPFKYTSGAHKEVYPLLERVGMKVTPAPAEVIQCINTALKYLKLESQLHSVSRISIFYFYTKISVFAAQSMQPADIGSTAFQNVESFVTFTKYLLDNEPQQSDEFILQRHKGQRREVPQVFPESPFGHFLLLTADGVLRMFDEESKALMSPFSSVFPNSASCFLHPSLLSVRFTKSYLTQPEDQRDVVESLILRVVEENLPMELKSAPMVSNAATIISRERLCSIWKCFAEDSVFGGCISCTLADWSLLLSKDDRLFSTSSNIIPVVDDYSNELCVKNMHAVAEKIGMPFLDRSVVMAAVDCPSLSDGCRILSNVYHIHKEAPIQTNLSQEELDDVISYLKFREVVSSLPLHELGIGLTIPQHAVLRQVKSLPLFENIDGSYTSLVEYGNAYVWPSGACGVAYKKWLEGYDAVFIKWSAKWSQLGSAEKLMIRRISIEELYSRFIFPNYHMMDSKERYQHLEYIRNSLYDNMKRYSELQIHRHSSNHERAAHSRAITFLNGLKWLKCIGEDNDLHKISEYCDHTVDIFSAFPNHFLFLPMEFKRDDEWLPFLRELGMRQEVSQEEFLQFCQETANGKVKEVKKSSILLLEWLFCHGHGWDHVFLTRVSEIAFVLQAPLPKLNWVLPAIYPVDQMVKLNGSAPTSRDSLLWTHKPIVELPSNAAVGVKKSLGIVSDPSPTDVITNVQNICEKSQYAQQGLFSNYPDHLVCSKGKYSVLHILAKNFAYLNHSQMKMVGESDVRILKSLPCIPVYHSTGRDANESRIVLVKPCQVVHCQWSVFRVKKFHPYLHCLPEELNSYANLLQLVGVKDKLELHHMQIVLERAYEASEDCELDVNTDICVKLVIKTLDDLLKPYQHKLGDAGPLISPLYLPDSENKLKPSKSLLYGDTINFWGRTQLDLSDVPYFYFDIKTAHYTIDAKGLCDLLPDIVRPIGMSTLCKQVVSTSSQLESEDSEVASQLMKSVQFEEIPAGIVSFLSRVIGKQDNSDDLKAVVRSYLDQIEVITVDGLRVDIILIESNKSIGTMQTNFCFVPGETQAKLYLDSSLTYPVDNDDAYLDVAQHLCDILCQNVNCDVTVDQRSKISKLIKQCLKVSTTMDLKRILENMGVDLEGRMYRFEKKLGEEIPACWHHRLDQDIDNVFNPMEYVGYEDREDHIIVAQIVHPVIADEEAPRFERKYRIYVKEDDLEGIDVSILSLYKFIVGRNKVKIQPAAHVSEQEVVIFDGDDELPKLRQNIIDEDLITILKKLCEQLREIWRLPDDQKKKAIRRLFLKWHPDKNADKPELAEKVFKFLMKQIEHLENGRPLDDPEVDVRTPSTSGSTSYRRSRRGGRYRYYGWRSSRFNFNHWNDTAYNHSSSSNFESTFFGGGGGGGGGGRGGDGGESGGGSDEGGYRSGGAGEGRCRADYCPFDETEEEKNPEEGHRWVSQAEAEFRVLMVLHGQMSSCSGYSYVCFMAHQVVERALKGGVYALCGMDGRSHRSSLDDHNLSKHALALLAEKPDETQGLDDHAIPLEDYYLKTRYPNQWEGYTDIPCDHYTQEDAEQAKDHAKAVLDIVNTIMPPQNDD